MKYVSAFYHKSWWHTATLKVKLWLKALVYWYIDFWTAGAGKTSLIKIFYRALHGFAAVHEELIVNSKVANEGTLLYTEYVLKGTEVKFEKKGKKYEVKDDQIIIHDTRGQIWMDQREQA